jgi:hypothetical protein
MKRLGVNRWDEKAGFRLDAVRSQVIDVLEAQIKRRPAMKKVSTRPAIYAHVDGQRSDEHPEKA